MPRPSAGERRAGRAPSPTTADERRGGSPAGGTGGATRSGSTDRRRGLTDVIPRVGGSQSAEERRFSQVYAEDRVGPMPYPNQSNPDIAAARARVRSLVGDLLPGGVDEGTGAALDPLIASWASGWLSRIDSQHADHHAVVDRLVGGARRQLADAEASHERDRRALEIARTDYADARERLVEPGAAPDGAAGPGRSAPADRSTRDAPSSRRARSGAGRPSLLERFGGRSGGGTTTPSGAGPSAAARREPAAPRRPGPDERVGPSEPATRPVPIAPSSYGSTFDEPPPTSSSRTPSSPTPSPSPSPAPSPSPRTEEGTA